MKEEAGAAAPATLEPGAAADLSLDVGLRGSDVAAQGMTVVGAREQMKMGDEQRRRRPVHAGLGLGRDLVGLQRVLGPGRATDGGESAHLQGAIAADGGGGPEQCDESERDEELERGQPDPPGGLLDAIEQTPRRCCRLGGG